MVLVSYVDAVWAMNPYSGHLLLVFLSTVILFVSFFFVCPCMGFAPEGVRKASGIKDDPYNWTSSIRLRLAILMEGL